jgi:hypothetical protein
MFLPVLVLHRYGWEGFAVFAIPNIVGCTLFGYIVRTPERSRALVEKYARAMSLFAIVTIAFHAFFISILLLMQYDNLGNWMSVLIPIVIIVGGGCLSFLPSRTLPILALVIWVASLVVGFTLLPLETEITQERPWQDVLWLAPITIFGFLLCPYLDPTFHKAIQSSPSKHAFGVFGLAFAIMIAVTCLYHDVVMKTITLGIGVHLVAQTLFTVGVHFKEGATVGEQTNRRQFVVIALLASIIAIGIAHRPQAVEEGLVNDYLRFFVFYGLVFPGIVSTFMLAKRAFTPMRIAMFCVVALASLPLLEQGYIGESPWMSVLPVVALLVWLFTSTKCPGCQVPCK